MTNGSAVTPSFLRARMRGTVSRRIGCGVGLARLVLVSSWKVVDMMPPLAFARPERKTSPLGAAPGNIAQR